MPNIEERLQALEQEHATLKKTIELQTIAIGALVNKAALEKLNEKYDKIFDSLITHDRFTNERLGDIQNQLIELNGKIIGQQTETRQYFTELNGKIVGLQTEVHQRFTEQDNKIAGLQATQAEHTTLLQQILARLPNPPTK